MKKKITKNQLVITVLYVIVFFTLTSCFPSKSYDGMANPSGFFMGIWHGWIAPFSLILGIFDSSVSIYDVNNTGWWYDLGFYMAIISGFGGLQLIRKSRRDY